MTPAAFVALYALATVAFVPGAWMTLLGGSLFGIARGAAYSFLGAVAGSSLAFFVARRVARQPVARALASRPRIAAVERAVSARGLPLVLLLRLSPIVPFNVLNYALGLTTIRYRDFVAASVGMIPPTIMYAYAGRLAAEAAGLAGPAGPGRGASYYGLLVIGFAATGGAVLVVTRTARRALRDV